MRGFSGEGFHDPKRRLVSKRDLQRESLRSSESLAGRYVYDFVNFSASPRAADPTEGNTELLIVEK